MAELFELIAITLTAITALLQLLFELVKRRPRKDDEDK